MPFSGFRAMSVIASVDTAMWNPITNNVKPLYDEAESQQYYGV